MIVSLVALCLATTGTTYAVGTLPKRSVGSHQLKKGAVRKEHIAPGAVTASKLAPGLFALAPAGSATPTAPAPGKEGPSGGPTYAPRAGWADRAGKADTAPLADTATTAATAGSATIATHATSAETAADAAKLGGRDPGHYLSRSTFVDLPRRALATGDAQVILVHGPFKYTARCASVGGNDVAEVLISTTRDHSAFDGEANGHDVLRTSDPSARPYARLQAPAGEARFFAQNDGTAVAPGGAEVRSTVWYLGLNLFDTAGRCYFGGFAII